MALEWISAIPQMASTGASIYRLMQGTDMPPGLQEAIDAAHAGRVYSQAAADPTHPFFQNLTGTEEEKIRADFVEAIRQIQRQNNRAAARGIFPVGVNPERRDESVYRALLEGFENARGQARGRARQYLQTAATGQLGASAALGRSVGASQKYQAANTQREADAQTLMTKSIAEISKMLSKALQPQQQKPTPVDLSGYNYPQGYFGDYGGYY